MKMIILASGQGMRMREVCGGRPKQFLDVGGETVVERLLDLAGEMGLDPLIVTRPEHAADFGVLPAEVLVEERPVGMLTTLFQARGLFSDPFVWVAGDLVFSEHEPLRRMVAEHDPETFASYLYCGSSRFKAKVRFEPRVEVEFTREGDWIFSMPAIGIQSPRLFSYMEAAPESNFVAPALAAGEAVRFCEYGHRIFEIDTPLDLAEARAHFARCGHSASIS